MASISIIYASTSGHTEYVMQILGDALREAGQEVTTTRCEKAMAADLTKGDLTILACGTWNADGVEGQLNPHMRAFFDRVKEADVSRTTLAIVGLGDARYRYTGRCIEHLQKFRMAKKAAQLLPPLLIVNEPYGQEERVRGWAQKVIAALSAKK